MLVSYSKMLWVHRLLVEDAPSVAIIASPTETSLMSVIVPSVEVLSSKTSAEPVHICHLIWSLNYIENKLW